MTLRSQLVLVWVFLLHAVSGSEYEGYEEAFEDEGAEFMRILEKDFNENPNIPKHTTEVPDGKCVFPFTYLKDTFYTCTDFPMYHDWCSLNKTFQGSWKYCHKEDYPSCVFPFWYKNRIFWECTNEGSSDGRRWCSVTEDFHKDGAWKYC